MAIAIEKKYTTDELQTKLKKYNRYTWISLFVGASLLAFAALLLSFGDSNQFTIGLTVILMIIGVGAAFYSLYLEKYCFAIGLELRIRKSVEKQCNTQNTTS